jgi:16S rRNA (cytidine1402-2'-O)-methyltransferase
MKECCGTLFVCSTPIGNLQDASPRLISTLKEAGLIIAEDTRTLKKLFLRFEIKKPSSTIISYQDYSSDAKIRHVIDEIKNGKNAALVSEAGTPAIQDPGYKIIRDCIKEHIKVSVIPGPSAAISALIISGLPTDSFLFLGFPPKKNSKLIEKLQSLKYLPYTLIFYESPLRIINLLKILADTIGNRSCCVAREITKLYEETIRGNIKEVSNELIKRQDSGRKLKGEIVLVVQGHSQELITDYSKSDIINEFRQLVSSNISSKEALKILRSRYDIDRNHLYEITTKIK